ncbi:MAG: hypothetical protein DKINENOH_04849 [bacterium]|nr:hypothetical protein [bacterium]
MKVLNLLKSFLLFVCLTVVSAYAQSFTKITSGPLVAERAAFMGTAWGDYDGDGQVDLLVANYGGANLLFHNEGGGNFTKITAGEIVTDMGPSFSAAWGDYDHDNDLDLFVANNGGGNFLYRNEGTSFARVGQGAITTDKAKSNSASWGDYDSDGDLDLFVANDASNNFLYENDGDGSFAKITSGIIVTDQVRSSVIGLWGDYDNDEDLDLYVVNGYFSLAANFLYRNEGHGAFTKITTGRIVTDVEGSSGGSWGDYDNDGYLDLYVTNSVNDAPNSLYHNNRDGSFSKVLTGAIVGNPGHSVGSSWVDYDNDGDLDLFVANALGQKNTLYRNDGNATFTRVTSGEIVNDVDWSFGCSWADYDNDGDQDAIVTNGGFFRQGSNFVYQNNGNSNQWLTIQCVGTVSNTSAIGAVVRVKANIAGKAVWQTRQISAQTGFLGQNCMSAAFGLGDAATVDSLEVRWPSGSRQVLTNVMPKQFLPVIEPRTTVIAATESAALPAAYRLSQNYPNPFALAPSSRSAATTVIAYEIAAANTPAVAVELALYNLHGQLVCTLVHDDQTPGKYSAVWNGFDARGLRVPSGVYFYRLKVGAASTTKRLIVFN